MLLFILTVHLLSHTRLSFNTSHVTLYRFLYRQLRTYNTFQYISCYSLSCSYHSVLLPPTRFNTSHVTLYRISSGDCASATGFQYISCYSLSMLQHLHLIHNRMFQYISCYSLSFLPVLVAKPRECFNTSHVTLYLMRQFLPLPPRFCFNTSHVTLYRATPPGLPDNSNEFQYISCYSLSQNESISCLATMRFQYISCYSLSYFHNVFLLLKGVSIHLMLLFISARRLKRSRQHKFQYISCYSLSLVFPIFSLLTFFIISQNTRVCNIFPKQHRLFESFHRSTPKPYIFTTFHIFL